MAFINLNNVSISFPLFNSDSRSLKKSFYKTLLGSKINFFDDKYSIKSLSNLSMSFKDGDRVGIIGPNGSGKSTFLRTISGIYYPSNGTITKSGSICSLIDVSFGINPDLTGIENIYLRCSLMGIPIKDIKNLLDKIIDFSELGNYIRLPVKTYSSGMQLRLAFSISTIIYPDILIMDEWLSVGDDSFQIKAKKRLDTIVKKTKILFVASHSNKLISSIANKLLVLNKGEVVFFGKIDKYVIKKYLK